MFLLVAVALLLFLAVLTVLYQQVDAHSRVDEARRVDAIIVLGSAVWPGERPSPSLYARMQHAIARTEEYASARELMAELVVGPR